MKDLWVEKCILKLVFHAWLLFFMVRSIYYRVWECKRTWRLLIFGKLWKRIMESSRYKILLLWPKSRVTRKIKSLIRMPKQVCLLLFRQLFSWKSWLSRYQKMFGIIWRTNMLKMKEYKKWGIKFNEGIWNAENKIVRNSQGIVWQIAWYS